MTIVAWLLAMALLTWYFSGVIDRQRNPNQQVASRQAGDTREVVLQRNRWDHYVASGEVNGRPVTFMLDTGATHVAVPMHLADTLGLRPGSPIPVDTANGQTTAYLTRIDHLALGDLHFEQVRGGLVPGMEGDQVLLGMSVLSELTLIQEGKQLIIRQ